MVRIEAEEPNKFILGDDTDSYDKDFYKIFTICPYTTKWLNERNKENRRVAVCFPFDKKYSPKDTKKKFPIA